MHQRTKKMLFHLKKLMIFVLGLKFRNKKQTDFKSIEKYY